MRIVILMLITLLLSITVTADASHTIKMKTTVRHHGGYGSSYSAVCGSGKCGSGVMVIQSPGLFGGRTTIYHSEPAVQYAPELGFCVDSPVVQFVPRKTTIRTRTRHHY